MTDLYTLSMLGRYTQSGLTAVEALQSEIQALNNTSVLENESFQISEHEARKMQLMDALKALKSLESAPQPLQKLFWAAKVRTERYRLEVPTRIHEKVRRPDIPVPDMSVRSCLVLNLT